MCDEHVLQALFLFEHVSRELIFTDYCRANVLRMFLLYRKTWSCYYGT